MRTISIVGCWACWTTVPICESDMATFWQRCFSRGAIRRRDSRNNARRYHLRIVTGPRLSIAMSKKGSCTCGEIVDGFYRYELLASRRSWSTFYISFNPLLRIQCDMPFENFTDCFYWKEIEGIHWKNPPKMDDFVCTTNNVRRKLYRGAAEGSNRQTIRTEGKSWLLPSNICMVK